MSTQRTRHDQNHWQQLVDQQAGSGLSGAQFCREHQIRYANFMSWRKRLGGATRQPDAGAQTSFVELTAPSPATDNPSAGETSSSPVCIELTLGAGIELRITRSA